MPISRAPIALRPLYRDQPDTARHGGEKHGLALLELMRAVEQILHGHALGEGSSGCLVVDPRRQLDELLGGFEHRTGIRAGPGAAGVADTLARLECLHAAADLFDDAYALNADAGRQLGRMARAADAQVDVGEVESDGLVADQHLTRTRIGEVDFLPLEDVGPAVLVQDECVRFHLPPVPGMKVRRRSSARANENGGPEAAVWLSERDPLYSAATRASL